MGCYPPISKFVSKALGKCNGRERWRQERLDYAFAYPPTEIHYMRPVARTVSFASTNSVYVIPPQQPPPQQQQESPPEPQQPQTPPQQEPEPEHQDAPPQTQPEQPAEAKAEPQPPPAQTQDAPPAEAKPPKAPKRGKKKQSGRVRFGPGPEQPPPQEQQQPPPPPQEQEHEHEQGPAGDGGSAPGHQPAGPHPGAPPAQAPQGLPAGFLLRYTPSPLPRWEATPRRHEYFSGEYRSYYPTPVREGIYRIATDANRLTTIFSEENPNACTIV